MTTTDKPKLKEGPLHPELAAELQAEYQEAQEHLQQLERELDATRSAMIEARERYRIAEGRHAHQCAMMHALKLMLAGLGMPVKEER